MRNNFLKYKYINISISKRYKSLIFKISNSPNSHVTEFCRLQLQTIRKVYFGDDVI